MFPTLLVAFTLAQTPPPPPDRTEKEIERLVQALGPKTPLAERRKALDKLNDLGPAARSAIPALIKLLCDDDAALRRRAVGALKSTLPTDLALVDPLVDALRGDDPFVQRGIGEVLAGIGPIATAKLNKLLDDPAPAARRGGATALEPFGVDALASTKRLKKALADADAGVRFAAAKALIAIDPKEKASYPVAAEGLIAADPYQRQQALDLLTRNEQQNLASPYFKKMLLSPDEVLRSEAMRSLRQLGAEAMPIFIEGLGSADLATRRDAAAGLFDVMQLARRAVARLKDDEDPAPAQKRVLAIEEALGKAEAMLTKLLDDPDPELRFASARTMYFLHRDLGKTLPLFEAALRDKDDKLRRAAVKLLRDLPDNSERLLNLLVAAAKDPSPDVRLEALTGLWVTHGETAVAQNALIEALQDATLRQNVYAMIHRLIGQGHDLSAVLLPLAKHSDEKLRERGVALLRKPGVEDDKVKAALLEALKDKAAGVRLQAVQSITATAEPPEDVVAPLVAMLEDPHHEVRMATVIAMRRFQLHARMVVPALVGILRDKNGFVRSSIADTLTYFRDDSALSVPGLVRALKEEDDDYVRERLIRALALFGPDAKEAVPELLEIVRKAEPPNAGLALVALSRIGPDAKAALPVLIDALKKDGASKPVQDALASIGPDAVPQLLKLLQAEQAPTRLGAAAVLGRVGPAANAGEALEARLKDDDPMVRIAAALAHFQVTGETKAALAALGDACKTRDRKLRVQALKNIKEMAAAAEPIVPLLVSQLGDPDMTIRRQVEDTLQTVDPAALERARAAM